MGAKRTCEFSVVVSHRNYANCVLLLENAGESSTLPRYVLDIESGARQRHDLHKEVLKKSSFFAEEMRVLDQQ